MESLDIIFSRYNTDKNRTHHNYTRQYEALLSSYRDKPISILEIGVFKGESSKALRDAFKNAKVIVGADINPETAIYNQPEKGIHIEVGDATDKGFIQYLIQTYGTFDIVLDDGSHTNRDVIKSFQILFPLLNDNGLYIVEDTCCFQSSIDKSYPNHLDYFTRFIPYLNRMRNIFPGNKNDTCVDPFKIIHKTTDVFEYSIDRIEFGCSYIAIAKKIRQHWI